MSVNSSGTNPLPNEIQNTQTQATNFDASHIICGANGIPDNIEVKGNMTFAPPYTFNLNRIRADDLLCGVMCNDGGDLQLGSDNLIRLDAQTIQLTGQIPNIGMTINSSISADGGACGISLATQDINLYADNTVTLTGAIIDLIGNVGDMTMLENAIVTSQLSGATNMQWFDQNLIMNTPLLTINNAPSSQYFVIYGQSKGENETSQQFTLTYPNPEIGQSDITMNLYGYSDIMQFFQNNYYNEPDNPYIIKTGNTFRFVCPIGTMVEIEITWQLRYSFDGTPPETYFACGLYNQSDNVIVPQSLNWMCSSTSKFKWQTFKTSFTMSVTEQDYFPFYQNQNHNQWTDSDAGGNQRSSIKFKFYQFISYPVVFMAKSTPVVNVEIPQQTLEITNDIDSVGDQVTEMNNLTLALTESMQNLDPTQLDDINVTLDRLTQSISQIQKTQTIDKNDAEIYSQSEKIRNQKQSKQWKIDQMIAEAKEKMRLALENIAKYDNMSVGSALSFEQIESEEIIPDIKE